MEIRRCDKCNIELDPATVKEPYSWFGDAIKAIRLEVPFISVTPVVEGQLDDKDEFDNNSAPPFPRRKIDLCEICMGSFGALMGNWLK